MFRGVVGLFIGLSLFASACSDGDDDTATSESPVAETPGDGMTDTGPDESPAAAAPSAEICDADALVDAVEGGPDEGTLAGMTDDPVATAASSNPVLTTLVTAVSEADLVDTLNSADSVTVFAPTDCAFAALDPTTLEMALADPTGVLSQVLGFHVVAGERLSAEDLASVSELDTFSGAKLPVESNGGQITIGGGQATVVVPDIQTANATVHLIDHVMLPPSG
jgi:uncharacterized surface protein with fasciclin (FAS1) repeats